MQAEIGTFEFPAYIRQNLEIACQRKCQLSFLGNLLKILINLKIDIIDIIMSVTEEYFSSWPSSL